MRIRITRNGVSADFVSTHVSGDVVHATKVSSPQNVLILQIINGELSVPGVPDASVEIVLALTGNPYLDTLILAKVDDSVLAMMAEVDDTLNALAQENSLYFAKLEVSFPEEILTYRLSDMSAKDFYTRVKAVFTRISKFGAARALMVIVFNGDIIGTYIALDAGADVNTVDFRTGGSVLHDAAGEGYLEIVRILLAHHADVSKSDYEGDTALIYAARNGHLEVVKELIQAGADVNHASNARVTALMDASRNGHVSVVKELLERGANVDTRDFQAKTALLLAVKNGHLDVVKELLAYAADVYARDDTGLSVLNAAIITRNIPLVELLRAAGAQ